MKRVTLYSTSRLRGIARPETPSPEKPVERPAKPKWRDLYRPLLISLVALLVIGVAALHFSASPVKPAISQEAIDAAVARSLETRPLPSFAAKVYDAVKGAMVLVRATADALEQDEYMHKASGTGVVVVDRGTILTSLHVVAGAGRIRVVFADGLESDAKIIGQHPENDLAVLQATRVPDDLQAATLSSAKAVQEGEPVTAVGFPYGIGPSVSAGVISGLGREYQAPEGGSVLRELIQFDAAVNPGSSGGPLVNAAGEVIGIVTALLSPGERGAFSGIGFAVPIQSAAASAGLPPF